MVLEDRILGAWVGKSYGAAMGEPLEFAFNGRMFLGAVDVQEHALREWLVNEDDLYMNMAMLAVVADKGLTASSDDFAVPYREAKFLVWHANGQARQNVLAGIPAELAGHPVYNPHADDIDFQIECDYIGMISTGAGPPRICATAGARGELRPTVQVTPRGSRGCIEFLDQGSEHAVAGVVPMSWSLLLAVGAQPAGIVSRPGW